MSLDKNDDGKVSREEVPQRLNRLMQADTNGDGYISRAEAAKFVNTLQSRRGNQRPPRQSSGSGQQRPAFDQ